MNVARSKHVLSLLQQKGNVGIRSVTIGGFRNGGLSLNASATRALATRVVPRGGRKSRNKSSNNSSKSLSTSPTIPSRIPTMEIAEAMPLSCKEMDNSDLVMLGAMGNSDARKEILVRHIMTVDKVSYDTALGTFYEIADKNREGMWLLSIPYKIGIGVACTAAFASFPMVFDINTVQWFNEFYVTADIPEPKDLETPLEVGSWAWNWMEPPLGQISFFLLCLQYTRAQIANIGIRPYTQKIMSWRADSLAKAFPQYNAKIVKDFSESITFYDDKHGIRLGSVVAGAKSSS